MWTYLSIALGGATGALLRHLLASVPSRYIDGTFPFGTLLVNLLGSLIIGILYELIEQNIVAADLITETLLLTEPTCTYRIIFEQELQAAGVVPQAVIEFHAVEAIKQCAMVGLGVAVLPAVTIAAALDNEQLRTLTWRDTTMTVAHRVTTQVIYPKHSPSANLKALLSILQL